MTRRVIVLLALMLCLSQLDAGRAADSPAESVTFTKDIAPIFGQHCVVCHRPGDIAPMSLLTYPEAQRRAERIAEKVVGRQMPPWHADPRFGEFANERRLSEREIERIVAWVKQGAKEGDPKDLPPPAPSEGRQTAAPDAVVTMAEEFTLGAEVVDDYLYFRVPTNFKEDRWIQSVEFRPGNRRVVHHAIAFIETPEQFARAARLGPAETGADKVWSLIDTEKLPIELMDGATRRIRPDAPVIDDGCGAADPEAVGGRSGGDVLSVYAPGRGADVWPAGAAKKIPAGSNIVFQMHYSKGRGKVARDRTSVALTFARGPVKKVVSTRSVSNQMFAIPPGAPDHEVTACWTYRRDVELISFMPHMHVRGKSMRYEIVRPGGRRETLLNVPRYSFHWQTLYALKRPLEVASGSRLIVTAHFDNSARNMHNPDPTKTIRHGSATFDEMMVGFVNYLVPKSPERAVVRVDPAVYDAYVGRYEFDPTAAVTVTKSAGRLFLESGGQRVELLPISETTFITEGNDSQLTFVRNGRGAVVEFNTVNDDQAVRFKKIPPRESAPR